MAIKVDFAAAKQYAEELKEHHPSETVQNLVNAFLILYREACHERVNQASESSNVIRGD